MSTESSSSASSHFNFSAAARAIDTPAPTRYRRIANQLFNNPELIERFMNTLNRCKSRGVPYALTMLRKDETVGHMFKYLSSYTASSWLERRRSETEPFRLNARAQARLDEAKKNREQEKRTQTQADSICAVDRNSSSVKRRADGDDTVHSDKRE